MYKCRKKKVCRKLVWKLSFHFLSATFSDISKSTVIWKIYIPPSAGSNLVEARCALEWRLVDKRNKVWQTFPIFLGFGKGPSKSKWSMVVIKLKVEFLIFSRSVSFFCSRLWACITSVEEKNFYLRQKIKMLMTVNL